jgi:hypothetical protein
MAVVRHVKVPYPVMLTSSQISVPEVPWVKFTPWVLAPKPVPVTVIRVPPELPDDGEIETRVGTAVIDV